jgi:Zn-dependent oligopeptidase
MLENWCWQHDTLKMLSGHYENHSELLPDDLITATIKTKNVCVGLMKLRQISLGMFDIEAHKATNLKDPSDLSKMFNKIKGETALIQPPDNTNYPASFLHLCAGYDVGYYG